MFATQIRERMNDSEILFTKETQLTVLQTESSSVNNKWYEQETLEDTQKANFDCIETDSKYIIAAARRLITITNMYYS